MRATSFLLSLTALAHAALNTGNYNHNHAIENSPVTVYWKVVGDEMHLGLDCKSAGTNFIGFGLAEDSGGSMKGSDIMVATHDGAGKFEVKDYFAVGYWTPSEDTCHDWKLVNGGTDANGMWVEVTRKLDTKDLQDRPFRTSPIEDGYNVNRVVTSWGTSNTMVYHNANRATDHVFFGTPVRANTLATIRAQAGPGKLYESMTIVNDNYEIPAGERTTYWNLKHDLRGFFNDKPDAFIVAFEIIIGHRQGTSGPLNNQTNKYLHHVVVQNLHHMTAVGVMWLWVPGALEGAMPHETALRFGNSALSACNGIDVQYHFDNPDGDSNQFDFSGIKFYYTFDKNAIKHEAGFLQLGDPLVNLAKTPVPAIYGKHRFSCPGRCTKYFQEDITIIGKAFHMHSAGRQAFTEHYRPAADGSMIKLEEWRIDYYDWRFENFFYKTTVVKPGDTLNLTCVLYNPDGSITWGFGSDQEMCIDFLIYYPIQHVFDPLGAPVGSVCGYSACGDVESFPIVGRADHDFGKEHSGPTCPSGDAKLPGTKVASPEPARLVTFEQDVNIILGQYMPGFKGPTGTAGLALGDTAQSAYDALVCQGVDHINYVTPYDPDNSKLLIKLLGCKPSQYSWEKESCLKSIDLDRWGQDPHPTPIKHINIIKTWIRSGALYNASSTKPLKDCVVDGFPSSPASTLTSSSSIVALALSVAFLVFVV